VNNCNNRKQAPTDRYYSALSAFSVWKLILINLYIKVQTVLLTPELTGWHLVAGSQCDQWQGMWMTVSTVRCQHVTTQFWPAIQHCDHSPPTECHIIVPFVLFLQLHAMPWRCTEQVDTELPPFSNLAPDASEWSVLPSLLYLVQYHTGDKVSATAALGTVEKIKLCSAQNGSPNCWSPVAQSLHRLSYHSSWHWMIVKK